MINRERIKQYLTVAAAIGAVAAGLPCRATALEGTLTDDAYTVTGNAANFGKKKFLIVNSNDQAFVRFDLSSAPAGSVTAATLTLYVNKVRSPGSLEVHAITSGWTEGTITGNAQPTFSTTIDSVPISSGNTFVSVDVTPQVANWLSNPSANLGLALITTDGLSAQFDSKESTTTSHPAVLDVTLAAIGVAGPQGPTGATGPQGAQGLTGAAGATGLQGPAGASGAQGAAGPLGATGVQGLSGAAGATGLQGPVGASGVQGALGPVGATGAQGLTGASGAQGAVGPVGATGVQGLQGLTGATGLTGLQGSQGVQGNPGPTGATGPSGPPGPSGSTLVTGATQNSVSAAAIGTQVTATASCAAGSVLLGGGAQVTTNDGGANKVEVQASYPSSTTTWTAVGVTSSSLAVNRTMSVTAYALCSQ